MKKRKIFALTGVTLLAAGTLAACSGGSKSSSSTSNTFSYVYETDPENLNYLLSSKATIHNLTSNLIDTLMENDRYGNLVPGLAEDWSVSKDGLTYTYKLRKGAKWYTSEGEEYAKVTAQDFVTGLKYAADNQSEQLSLVEDSIVGLKEYKEGTNKDFSSVGIKAVDDQTVQYTLKQPESYWNSKVTNGILSPLNADFVTSKGDKFATATDPASLLYNGPFILKAITAKSSIELTKNKGYWDKANVHFDNIKLSFFDGSDIAALERGFTDGSYSKAILYPTGSNYSAVEKKYKDNIIYSQQDAGTYLVSTNIDRQSYHHTSKTTEAEKISTKKALLNKDFRQAINFAFNREDYAAQINGKEGAKHVLRNLFVPPTFVQANGKYFYQLVSEKLSENEEFKDVNFSDGENSLYNLDKAKKEFEKAKKTLQADGVQFPIHIDMPVDQANVTRVKRVQSMKQSIEKSLGSDNVVIDIQQMSKDEVNNIQFYAPNAASQDWDLSDNVGWNPDFQDPSTYLDVFDPSNGELTKTYIGIENGLANPAATAVGLDEYKKLLDDANHEQSDVTKRYEKYAAAQAWLTDSSIVFPSISSGGLPTLQRLTPFTAAFAWAGGKGTPGYIYKYLEPSKDVVTAKDYEKAKEKWEKERAEANKKAQEESVSHVK